jgi:hypothetical protein
VGENWDEMFEEEVEEEAQEVEEMELDEGEKREEEKKGTAVREGTKEMDGDEEVVWVVFSSVSVFELVSAPA